MVTGSSQVISKIEVSAHADTSHETSSERFTKVTPRKYRNYTHFLQDRNSEVCKRTKMTRALCRRRNGEEAVPRANHKVFKKGSESRNSHRYAVRGWSFVTGEYSSFCGCKGDLVLDGFDHMEDDDQDRGDEENGQKEETLER